MIHVTQKVWDHCSRDLTNLSYIKSANNMYGFCIPITWFSSSTQLKYLWKEHMNWLWTFLYCPPIILQMHLQLRQHDFLVVKHSVCLPAKEYLIPPTSLTELANTENGLRFHGSGALCQKVEMLWDAAQTDLAIQFSYEIWEPKAFFFSFRLHRSSKSDLSPFFKWLLKELAGIYS